jgi:hypothetical protein
VDPLALEPFGPDTPPALSCLSLRYHMAQKIHGTTQPPKGGEEANGRFRDLGGGAVRPSLLSAADRGSG